MIMASLVGIISRHSHNTQVNYTRFSRSRAPYFVASGAHTREIIEAKFYFIDIKALLQFVEGMGETNK